MVKRKESTGTSWNMGNSGCILKKLSLSEWPNAETGDQGGVGGGFILRDTQVQLDRAWNSLLGGGSGTQGPFPPVPFLILLGVG